MYSLDVNCIAQSLASRVFRNGLMNRILGSVSVILLIVSCNVRAQQQPLAVEVNSFESAAQLQSLKAINGRVALSTENATAGRRALKVEFDRPGEATVQFSSGDKPWDWSAYGGLAFDLVNPSGEEISFSIRIRDDPSGEDKHRVSGHGTVGPHLKVSYMYPLGPSSPAEHGMVGGPPFPGIVPVTYTGKTRVNEGHIVEFEISFEKPRHAPSIYMDNIRLMPLVTCDGIVDKFGQYTREDWAGKVKNEAALVERKKQEEAAIQGVPSLADRDEYGGWASGPQVTPTGFFTTTLRDGKWWLVDPSGHLFFSLGIDVIALDDGPTMVGGREKMFTWLPDAGDPLARHFGYTADVLYGPIKKGRTFDFYAANVERRYGAQYLQYWRSFALDRLRAWGFNTVGNWSDAELFTLKRVPYTAGLEIHGDYARVSSGIDYWGKMHDPFDPKFAAAVETSLKEGVEKYRDDPWCLGYFVDNEVSWGGMAHERDHYGLVYGTLAGDKDSPAKRAFLEQLKLHYKHVKALNRAWNSSFRSWEALLLEPYNPGDNLTPQMKLDFSNFLKAFAQQYFQVVRDALKKHDPNHLYLGCRFSWRTPEAVEASSLYCDVVSFNVYRSHLEPDEWSFATHLNRPCIIGEFHFGALDRGMFHTGLVMTPNQQARAAMYCRYVESVEDNPAFVGCHWFQYMDEPLTGRTYDGENYNIGFVDVTDTPYPEMVDSARAVHGDVYKRRPSK